MTTIFDEFVTGEEELPEERPDIFEAFITGEEEALELVEPPEPPRRPTIFDELAGIKSSYHEEAEEAVDLAEQVRRGEISLSELPRDLQERLGYTPAGETIMPFGFPITPTEPIQVAPPEAREYLLKNPKMLSAIEGLGEIAGIGIPDEEKPPTVEDVFQRPKTKAETGIMIGTQLLAELPLFLVAETGAGVLLPKAIAGWASRKAVDFTVKELALRTLAKGIRGGMIGAIYHGTIDVADQLLDPSEINFDYGKLGGELYEGMKWWGILSAIGGPMGHAWGKLLGKSGRWMRGFDKLVMRAGGSELTARRLVNDASLEKYGGRAVIELRAKDGTRKIFGSVRAANQFISNLERNDSMRFATDGLWKTFRNKWTRSVAELESHYLTNPREIGALEGATYGKIIGNIGSLFQRVENKVLGPKALFRLRRSAQELGKTAEEIPMWMARHQQALAPFKLFTRFFGPVMDAERQSTKIFNRLYDYAWKRLYKPTKELSAKIGKSEDQIYTNIYMWLTASGRREAVNPKYIVSQIKRFRRMLDEGGPEAIEQVKRMISKLIRRTNMPREAEGIFESLVTGKSRNIAVGAGMIEKRFGRMIRPAPSEPAVGRLAPAETPKMRKLKKELATLPEHQREAIEAELGDPLYRVEELEVLLNMTEGEIVLAKQFRKFYNSLFNIAGLDPDAYMKWYAPMVNSGEVLTMEQLYSQMRGIPDYIKSRIRFFAEMHRQGEVFIPETNIKILTQKYMWGAARANKLAAIVNHARNSPSMLKARILKGTPIQKIAEKFTDDVITGMPNREKSAIFMHLHKLSGKTVPYEFFDDLAETMISNVYGATMGLRAWLVIRNLTQPWITTVMVTGPMPLAKAYLDIGNPKYWRDFWSQSIHMRKGGGLPYAEEVFRKFDKMSARGGWIRARQALGILREFNYATTKPYQLADTLNRFISYRAMLNRVNLGLTDKVVGNLAKVARRELDKIPTAPMPPKKIGKPWRLTMTDMRRNRYRASRNISKSKEMQVAMEKTGFNSAFMPVIVEDYKEKLAMLLTMGEISKKGIERAGGSFFPYGLKTHESIEKVIREAFIGKTGKLKDALALLDPMDKVMTKAVAAGFKDSFAKKAARQVVAETQWLYERKVQAPWLQKRWFGMFMTWPSNYIDFLNRHFRHIGTMQDKIVKAGTMAGVYSGLIAGLEYAGISPHYLFRSFAVPTGGPAAQALFDIAGLTAPIPEYEKQSRIRRLVGTPGKILVPLASVYGSVKQVAKGEKPVVRGLMAAPMSRSQYAEWHRPAEISWDMSKVNKRRVSAIKRLRDDFVAMDMARKTHGDPNVRKMAEERYKELWWALERTLRPIVKYVPGDPKVVADRVIEASERKGEK